MLTELKNIANQIANSRVRLESPFKGEQTREDVIKEAKNLESLESQLRNLIEEIQNKLNDLIE